MMHRHDFPYFIHNPEEIYLDNAATMHKPAVMLQAMEHFYTHEYATVRRGIYQSSELATISYDNARAIVAEWVGAQQSDVIFTSGCTASINTVAFGLAHTLTAGDEIVVSILEHHANFLPWMRIAMQRNCKLRVVGCTENLMLDMQQLADTINSCTKIVAITHMANSIGTLVDIATVSQLAHAVGARVLVDCAQTIGHLPVLLKDLGADYITFSGHKIGGPTGIGVLAAAPDALSHLEPMLLGGGAVRRVTTDSYTFDNLPMALEAGTPPIGEAIGLASAIKYWQSTVKHEILANQYRDLMQQLIVGLHEMPKLRIIGDTTHLSQHGHIVSFVHEMMHPHDIAEFLNQQNIAVRAGTHCAQPMMQNLGISGITRVSLAPYTTSAEIEKLLSALKQLK